MAKRKVQVRIANLSDYFMGKDSIIDVVVNAIENHDLLIFERVRSEALKEQVLYNVENLWDKAIALAQEDTSSIRRTIQITLDDINHASTCLKLGGYNLWGWVSYQVDLFRYHCRKIPLLEVLALHIAERGNNLEEKEELLQQIKQRITTVYDMHFLFEASLVRQEAPTQCPLVDCDGKDHSYLMVQDVPYLEKLCNAFKRNSYTTDELSVAWNSMMEKKARKVDSSKWFGLLEPDDALYVLFENLSYDEVLKHWPAYTTLIEDCKND